jgi:hypothetical protein
MSGGVRRARYGPRWLAALPALLVISCQSLHLNAPFLEKGPRDTTLAAPSKYQVRVSQFLFLSDFEVKRDLPLFDELAHLRDQVYQQLQLPPANTVVQIYLFEDRERYERFMKSKYPDLPKRRAFFVAQPRNVGTEDLLVYTYWGDRIQQDLRHELTHALLHAVLKDVPLWLDEGLAEYYEVPPECHGTNAQHLENLTKPGAKTDLARLEQLSQVQQMAPAEYREAWAWAHLLLHGKPQAKELLLAYLHQLKTTADAGLLRPRLLAVYPAPEDALAHHLARLDSAPKPTASK